MSAPPLPPAREPCARHKPWRSHLVWGRLRILPCIRRASVMGWGSASERAVSTIASARVASLGSPSAVKVSPAAPRHLAVPTASAAAPRGLVILCCHPCRLRPSAASTPPRRRSRQTAARACHQAARRATAAQSHTRAAAVHWRGCRSHSRSAPRHRLAHERQQHRGNLSGMDNDDAWHGRPCSATAV